MMIRLSLPLVLLLAGNLDALVAADDRPVKIVEGGERIRELF